MNETSSNFRRLYCCGCVSEVKARLTDGREIYPRRPDLSDLPFWKCDTCRNYVGCHHKTRDRTRPLGAIPTPEMKTARQRIHALIDPLWKSGSVPRGRIYERLSGVIGRQYHTAELQTLDEARAVYREGVRIAKEVNSGAH